MISRVSQDMKDKCSTNINEESSSVYIEHFIKQMSKDLLTRLFKTITEIEEYEELFKEYKYKYIFSEEIDRRNEEEQKFNKLTISINFVKADIYLRNGDRVEAGRIFISLLQLLCNQGGLIDQMDPTIVDVEQ